MKSPLYYAVLIALLIVLIVILFLLIRKRKREEKAIQEYQERMDKLRAERKAEAEKKQTHYTTYNETEHQSIKWRHGRTYIDETRHMPKFAAGDDMDKLHRPEPDRKGDLLYIAGLLVVLFCIAYIYFHM